MDQFFAAGISSRSSHWILTAALFQRSDCSVLGVRKMYIEDVISLFKAAQREDAKVQLKAPNDSATREH